MSGIQFCPALHPKAGLGEVESMVAADVQQAAAIGGELKESGGNDL
jgi:hypothetical protein